MKKGHNESGFGCPQYQLAVYIGNQPNMIEYQNLVKIQSLTTGEITAIGQACGNGWRKVFNVYAKLIFALNPNTIDLKGRSSNWQQYRDAQLLQKNSFTALLFSAPELSSAKQTIHIICGKTHANYLIESQQLAAGLNWLDHEFAIDKLNRLIVCPYFDYRQLSNIKIERLSKLIDSLLITA